MGGTQSSPSGGNQSSPSVGKNGNNVPKVNNVQNGNKPLQTGGNKKSKRTKK